MYKTRAALFILHTEKTIKYAFPIYNLYTFIVKIILLKKMTFWTVALCRTTVQNVSF